MRTIFIAAALLPAAVLAGCASDSRPSLTAQQMDKLRADCEARGGLLVPSGRRYTGEVALDYPCRIHGATALPPRG
jgi:hypothetical protein